MDNRVPHEESLDPSDWRQLRQLGHRMLDDMFDFMQTAREKSVWQPIPSEVLEALAEPLPQQGHRHRLEGLERDLAELDHARTVLQCDRPFGPHAVVDLRGLLTVEHRADITPLDRRRWAVLARKHWLVWCFL